jgi:hypothetical protein
MIHLSDALENDATRELRDTIEPLMNGVRDPDVVRRAYQRMDRMREKLDERLGIVYVAVELIRKARGEWNDVCRSRASPARHHATNGAADSCAG